MRQLAETGSYHEGALRPAGMASAPRTNDSGPAKRVCVAHPEKMAKGGGDGVRDVGSPTRAASGNEPGHHGLDLFLLGAAVAADGLLDRGRAVLENRNTGAPQRGENNPACMGELKRRASAHPVERSLDCGFRRGVLLYD